MAGDDAFLSRWSRRKALARQGQPLAEPPPPPAPAAVPAPEAVVATVVAPPPAAAPEPAAPPAPPPPTLEEVARLPADASDFSRFVARGVQPEVKNAALKKLFADPHFNVMDGLDIYIDDYGKPDPLPASMLRQMVQSRFLGLFDDEEDDPKKAAAAPQVAGAAAPDDLPDPPAPDTVGAAAEPLTHEDADLRLQPDPAAGLEGDPAGALPAARREP